MPTSNRSREKRDEETNEIVTAIVEGMHDTAPPREGYAVDSWNLIKSRGEYIQFKNAPTDSSVQLIPMEFNAIEERRGNEKRTVISGTSKGPTELCKTTV